MAFEERCIERRHLRPRYICRPRPGITWDLLGVAQEKPLALQKALVHGGINTAVIIAYSFLALRAYANYPNLVGDTVALLVIKACLVTFMLAGNYMGGSLILKYRVGLRNDQGPS